MYLVFNNVNSETLGIILTSKKIAMPSVKTSYVEIDGRDGAIDFTDYFGNVRYNDRTITCKFASLDPTIDKWQEVANVWQGKKGNISFSDDLNYHFVGRISLDYWTRNGATGEFTATIKCEPYRYKNTKTTITKQNNQTITLVNDAMPTIPKVRCTGTTTLTFGDYSVSLSAGEWVVPFLELKQGDNEITLSGTGNVVFEYQEGAL